MVSVIMATYNRSNILPFCIDTVVRQTVENWELWVVGDACTDDTQEVMSSFDDPRIRFVNLPRNVGDQSGPNNEGFRRSSGRYIAYLNHDDLWLTDHLESCVREVETHEADVVFSMVEVVRADGPNWLSSVVPDQTFAPYMDVRASSWVIRREAIEEVGPWRSYRETFDVPSGDWLYRAWRAGKTIRGIPQLTVVAVESSNRPGLYAKREFLENEALYNRLVSEPDFRERESTAIARNYAIDSLDLGVAALLKRSLVNLIKRAAIALHFNPRGVMNLLRYGRRGGFIERLRRERGLVDPGTSQ